MPLELPRGRLRHQRSDALRCEGPKLHRHPEEVLLRGRGLAKRSLRLTGDSYWKVVVVNRVMKPYMDNDGILTMGLFDFLLDPDSLDM